MVDKKQLEEVYKQNLENDIINAISEMKGIDLRKAFDIYYSSKLAEQISNDSYGIENMDAKYLAEDLIENESELFNRINKSLLQLRGAISSGWDLLVSGGVQAPPDTTAEQLFGYEQVAKADCEYPIDYKPVRCKGSLI